MNRASIPGRDDLVLLFEHFRPSDETVEAMVRRLDSEPSLDGVGRGEAVTDAIKEVKAEAGTISVVGTVDRSELVTLGTPAVVRRTAWEAGKVGTIGLI